MQLELISAEVDGDVYLCAEVVRDGLFDAERDE